MDGEVNGLIAVLRDAIRVCRGEIASEGGREITEARLNEQLAALAAPSAGAEAAMIEAAARYAYDHPAWTWEAIRGGLDRFYTAPQTDARSPSYGALEIIFQSVCGALVRAGVTDCDDPGEAIDVIRERYEIRIAALSSGQPDARDAERLDYIERTFSGMTNRERYLPVTMIWGAGAMGRTLREACDKYMKTDAALAGPRT